jgi:hypothetical protein
MEPSASFPSAVVFRTELDQPPSPAARSPVELGLVSFDLQRSPSMAPSASLFRNLFSFRFPRHRSSVPDLRSRPHLEPFEDRLALNYSVGGAAVPPINLTTSDPAVFTVINHADDLAVPVNLGSNQFNFYGTTYQGPTSLYASSNGLITFGSGNSAYQNTDLTFQPFQPAIAPLWTDWLKLSGGPMLLGKLDTANNRLILQWDQILHQQSTTPVTFQVILQLNTGNVPGTITVSYVAINTNDRNANGATSTVGVKDFGFQGANRVLVSFNSTNPLVLSNQALQFTWNNPNPPPSLSSLSQTSAPEGSTAQIVTLTGSNFVSNSTAQVNGSPVATTFLSATQLQAIIPAAALTEEGSLAVSVVNPGSQSQTSNVLPFTVTDAPLSAGGVLLSATEGTAFTGTVATFTDANPNASLNDYQATISWGDGQSSPGTISANGQGGFTVSGQHAYEEGVYPVSVQITDLGGATATGSSTAFVVDAPVTATAVPVSATEGAAFNGVVATFADANPNAAASDFTATITWAAGQTSAGTIAVNPTGGFVVTGSFTYAEDGTYPVSVAITDRGGASAQASGTAIVADAPLTANGATLSATEGTSLSGVVATFTDANPNGSPADFQATISWGDGQSSAGMISAGSAGGFTVSGTHSFAEEGTYTIGVQVTDAGGAVANASSTATVADAPLTATAVPVSAIEGAAFSGTVATFTDANPNAPASDFTATITWATGQTSAGTVMLSPAGGFVVIGSFTYAEEGAYPVGVAITDQGGATAQVTSSATVADAPLTANGVPLSATEGASLSGVVATFTDANPNGSPADFQATISWGDGQTSAGTISVGSTGGFTVSGTHAFAEEGTYSLGVQITDTGGAAANASSTATVADAPLTATAVPVSATEGAAFTGTVATFTDANPNAPASDFTATITWATGQTSAGTVTANADGSFSVTGSYTYAEEGTYPISVAIADQGGAAAQAVSSATVADAPLAANGTALSATEGASLSAVVATFTDANPNAAATDFQATITWGDGQTSAGTVTANPAGGFLVLGTNTYAEEGSYPVTVAIADQGGATITTSTMATVADAPLSATGSLISVLEATNFSGAVATFTDANPNATAGDFTATILWGDGAMSAGTITANADGSFAVSGDHTYAEEGSYPVAVSILDQGGSMATAYSMAQVQDSIPVVHAWAFQGWDMRRVYLLGQFTDLELEQHTARIDWGDGTVTEIGLGTSMDGFLFRVHRYSERFVEHHSNGTHITVTVADAEGTTSDPEILTVEFHRHHCW